MVLGARAQLALHQKVSAGASQQSAKTLKKVFEPREQRMEVNYELGSARLPMQRPSSFEEKFANDIKKRPYYDMKDMESCRSSGNDFRFKNQDFVKALSYNKLFADYELGEIVGEGSYGRVYKALHKPTGLTRALKQIKLAEEGEVYSVQEQER